MKQHLKKFEKLSNFRSVAFFWFTVNKAHIRAQNQGQNKPFTGQAKSLWVKMNF